MKWFNYTVLILGILIGITAFYLNETTKESNSFEGLVIIYPIIALVVLAMIVVIVNFTSILRKEVATNPYSDSRQFNLSIVAAILLILTYIKLVGFSLTAVLFAIVVFTCLFWYFRRKNEH